MRSMRLAPVFLLSCCCLVQHPAGLATLEECPANSCTTSDDEERPVRSAALLQMERRASRMPTSSKRAVEAPAAGYPTDEEIAKALEDLRDPDAASEVAGREESEEIEGSTTTGMQPVPPSQGEETSAQPSTTVQPLPAQQDAAEPASAKPLPDETEEQQPDSDGMRPKKIKATRTRPWPVGHPTNVEFGILLKNFFEVSFPEETFTVDAVVMTRWLDYRNLELLPRGHSSLRLSTKGAEKQLWLPDISVMNTAHQGITTLSSSVLIEHDGTTSMVERSLLTLKANFDATEFPFDSQVLQIKIASGTYMADELQLVQTKNRSLWGAPETLTTAWSPVNESLKTATETDGPLSKSRGIFEFAVQRSASQYSSTVFLPSVMLVGMAWSVLWFPLTTPFVMPRVAMSAIALLSQIALAQKVESFSPAGKHTWLDTYLEMCFWMQFVTLIMNALAISLAQKPSTAAIAADLDGGMLLALPLLGVLMMACVWRDSLVLARVLVVGFAVGKLTHSFWGYNRAQNEAEKEKEQT
eukprot:TRINITY_DN4895_c0_g1_i4.p1 TRINITY_DN4895_c0_g1~~TRINITY_DN4895_c0_g1_i4.p1  ORF type:complete len:527 (-),score=77.86 TRINITY_DN4895_c0_g1_i4:135-1715(-)